jgi:hypothetical protein
MRVEQRECANDVLDRRYLSCIALQELQSRRHVRKEVSHLQGHTGKEGTGSLLDRLPRPDPDRRAAARALDVGHGRNAGQSLTAKAKADDRVEVR